MSKLKLDKVNIIDLESTCWENNIKPKGMLSEIIEIGICTIDITSLKKIKTRSILVKPIQSEISDYCTNLTSITTDLVAKKGTTFGEACNILLNDFDSKNRVWGSWGDYDRAMFYEQCKSLCINYPLNKSHINLIPLFSLAYNLDKELGMAEALEIAKLELKGIHHRGIDDAINIAELFIDIIKRLRPIT